MRDFTTDIRDVSQRLKDASAYLRIDALRVRIAELEIEISKPDLWDDQERAKQVNTEYSNVKGDIDEYESLARAVEDVEVLHELAREEDDSSQEPDIEAGLDVVSRRLSVLEMRSLFTNLTPSCK
jgi:peptide chain release factor 2